MKQTLLLIIILFLIAFPVFSETMFASSSNGAFDFTTTHSVGIKLGVPVEMNELLKSYNLPEMTSFTLHYSPHWKFIFSNFFIIGLELQKMLKNSTTNQDYKVVFDSTAAYINLGCSLFRTKSLNIHTLVAFGGSMINLKIVDQLPYSDYSFDDIVSNPSIAAVMTYLGLAFNTSFNIEYRLLKFGAKTKNGKSSSIITGLQVGYIFSPFKGFWSVERSDITEGIHFDFSGFYTNITFQFDMFKCKD